MNRAFVALFVTAALLISLAAEADAAPVGHATAVQPSGCQPGAIHLDYDRRVTWMIDGDTYSVDPGGRDLSYPEGFDGSVIAGVAEDGPTDSRETIPLTIAPVDRSCIPADYSGWISRLIADVSEGQLEIAKQGHQIVALQGLVEQQAGQIEGLKTTVATQRARLGAQEKVITTRGMQINALRKQLRQCRRHGC